MYRFLCFYCLNILFLTSFHFPSPVRAWLIYKSNQQLESWMDGVTTLKVIAACAIFCQGGQLAKKHSQFLFWGSDIICYHSSFSYEILP